MPAYTIATTVLDLHMKLFLYACFYATQKCGVLILLYVITQIHQLQWAQQ